MLLERNDKLVRILLVSRSANSQVELADFYMQAGGSPSCDKWERAEATRLVAELISDWLNDHLDAEVIGYFNPTRRRDALANRRQRMVKRTRADKKSQRQAGQQSIGVASEYAAGRETKIKLQVRRDGPINVLRQNGDSVKLLLDYLQNGDQLLTLHLHPTEGSAHVKYVNNHAYI